MKQQTTLQKNIGIFFSIIIVCGVLGITIFYANQTTTPPSAPLLNQGGAGGGNSTTPKSVSQKTSSPTPSQTTPASTTPSYTLVQVEAHNSASSCWTIVGNNVYDLTSWINTHPGGPQAILSLCGKNGTAPFERQHGGQARPENELQSLEIGTYAN